MNAANATATTLKYITIVLLRTLELSRSDMAAFMSLLIRKQKGVKTLQRGRQQLKSMLFAFDIDHFFGQRKHAFDMGCEV